MWVWVGQRRIEGILSHQSYAFFAPLSIRQIFTELKLLESSLEHHDTLQPTRFVLVDRKSSQPVLSIAEDLNPLQVRCRLDHRIACMFLLKISKMRHGYNIIDTDKLLIEDSLQQV